MNKQGTHASVNHPSAVVTWAADGLYREESDSTMKVVDKRENPFNPPSAFRLTEKEQRRGALAEGTAGDTISVAIDTNVPASAGFGDGFLTIRKTTRIDRVMSSEPE